MFKGKYGPLLIAEIGGNHEGDFSYANDLTDLAIESKADVIKFQIYYPDSLVNKKVDIDRYDHFKKYTLTPEQHIDLAKKCINGGKQYLASVWDISAINWIDQYLQFYKIGSGDLTAYPVIEEIVEKSKPIILSTGLSTFEEVSKTVDFIRQKSSIYNNNNMLAVLQCTSMYPIPELEANLNVLKAYKNTLNVRVGYSDHTENTEALYLASVTGADLLEFHFTDSKKGKTFRDHKVSLTKNDVELLVERILRANVIFGNKEKQPTSSELSNNHQVSFRRSVYLNKNVLKGEMITKEHLVILRPNKSIDARDQYKIIGKRAKTDIKRLEVIDLKMFES